MRGGLGWGAFLNQLRNMKTLTKDNLTVSRKTKGTLPSVPFVDIKNKILGKKYDLSIAFVGMKESQKINFSSRKKNYPTNVLSFSLSKSSGEIIMSLEMIRRQAKDYGKTYEKFLLFLIIHGMFHLKGYDHGKEMEKEEKKLFKYFS